MTEAEVKTAFVPPGHVWNRIPARFDGDRVIKTCWRCAVTKTTITTAGRDHLEFHLADGRYLGKAMPSCVPASEVGAT